MGGCCLYVWGGRGDGDLQVPLVRRANVCQHVCVGLSLHVKQHDFLLAFTSRASFSLAKSELEPHTKGDGDKPSCSLATRRGVKPS